MEKGVSSNDLINASSDLFSGGGKPIVPIKHKAKGAKREIQSPYEALAQKVVELTTQLETTSIDHDAFTYSISHDLKAPLRVIIGYATILQEEYTSKLDDDGASALNAIVRNAKKMGELIEDLLAFSRLGRKVVSISEINMKSLATTVMNEKSLKNATQTEFILNDLIPAKGQQALIKQVWVNLISNALKFSQLKPKIEIEVGSYYKDDQVVYYVKDNGVGFDMKYYGKLFGVFQRLHSPDEYEGTGIRLALTKKIVTNHNGTVWSESKVNEGSCFYYSLPKDLS